MACTIIGADGIPYVEREVSPGRRICVPHWSPLATQPLYGSGGFVSTNPNALVTREFTDWSGQTTREYSTASRGYLGSVCVKNCGAGSGVFGFGGEAGQILGAVAAVGSQIALQAGLNVLAPGAGGALLSQVSAYGQSGGNMGLNLSGILGAAGQVLGGINTSGYGNISGILGGGLQIASAAFAPQPASQPMYGPAYNPYAVQTLASGTQAMRAAGTAVVAGTGLALVSKEAVKILLEKIAAALGRKSITLSRAVEIARKLGKFFTSPEAIATYLGLAVGELALLITAHSAKKRRRMNPANSHALRRAARRIKSFHRLCSHTDLIKTRRRSGARCGTCRKSPCRC